MLLPCVRDCSGALFYLAFFSQIKKAGTKSPIRRGEHAQMKINKKLRFV